MTRCLVYRSGKKAETYLYLAVGTGFDDLPEPLRAAFGEPVFVMPLELTPARRLAHADAVQVIAALEAQGYYVQLPPELPVEEEISRRFS